MNSRSRLIHEIAQAIRDNDLEAYQSIRYPEIGDGEEIIFDHEDFSGVNFHQFSLGFMTFKDCNLRDSHGYMGVNFEIHSSDARGVDFSDAHTSFDAVDSDFRGMIYNENTVLGAVSPDIPSTFVNCNLAEATKKHFEAQGVVFR